jgi:hypothetical protein
MQNFMLYACGVIYASLQDNQLEEAERQAHFDWLTSNLAHDDLVDGVVKSVQPYGVFVDIGEGVTTLLHISEISYARVTNVQKVFKVCACSQACCTKLALVLTAAISTGRPCSRTHRFIQCVTALCVGRVSCLVTS